MGGDPAIDARAQGDPDGCVLDAAVLLTELQRFADPIAPVFAGWPSNRPDARRKWAHAYAVYADDLVDVSPVLTPRAVSLVFGAIEQAFFVELTLENPTVERAAEDFADAWRAAVGALAPGASPVDGSSTPFTFVAMEPVDVAARWTQLRAALIVAFRTHASTRREDLRQIADAFHAATTGLRSTPTPYVVAYG